MTQPIPTPQHNSKGTALILGASGKFGRAAAEAFAAAGWTLRRFDRSTQDLAEAARDADVIINAQNPRSYELWDAELLPMHERVAEVARASGSTVILPGNVYVFGPEAPGPWGPGTPHLARNPLALLRQEMERLYRACGTQVIVLRCGDYLDTRASGGWFDRMMTRGALKGRLAYPGDPDAPHAWTFLPDAARAAVALAERREQLPQFADIPFEGYTLTGHELAAQISLALGRPVRARRMSWLPFRLARPFVPVMRGLFEMRYLWSLPQQLDPAPLQALLPDFRPTPMPAALAQSLAHLR